MQVHDSQFENYAKNFIRTWAYKYLVLLPHRVIGLFTGNQALKTSNVARQYVDRILGVHPIPKKNVLYFECESRSSDNVAPHGYYTLNFEGTRIQGWEKGTWNKVSLPKDGICPYCGEKIRIHKRKSRVFRFASENLPTEKATVGGDTEQSAEIKNAQYPEFKKWLPPFLIKKDITFRDAKMTLLDINANQEFAGLKYIGADIIVEFVSYSQQVQALAGVQRLSCWMDEHAPFDFYEEQPARLLAEDGDLIFTLTPAMGMVWEYDAIFEQASLFVRTDAVCTFLNEEERGKKIKKRYQRFELTDSKSDIAVIQAATDDNPTLSPQIVEEMYSNVVDPDGTVIPTRRYGIFKQATGRIFKDYSDRVHLIDPKKYFPDGFPKDFDDWVFARSQDFHTANAHAIVWVALSPQDEAFVYKEWSPSPDKWITEKICEEVGRGSGMTKFVCNLIDPLANTKNPNTSKTTIEEMNKKFFDLKREGVCSGGYWEPYNTKGEVGRDEIKKRLQNSAKVGEPFSNKTNSGPTLYLPTMWVFNSCRECARSLRQWRLETWKDSRQMSTKDKKETPAQKWSHFCTALEGLFKDKRFKARGGGSLIKPRTPKYFQGER